MIDQASPTRDQLRKVFIGRQPILDRDQGLVGYELLFRATAENVAVVSSGNEATTATADVVCKAFGELGLANTLGQARAFINVGALFLGSDLVELLPKEVVVLEMDVGAFATPSLLLRCQELKAKRYAYCISGVTDVGDHVRPLVDLATWLKIDIDGLEGLQLQVVARALGTTRRTLIAAHVGSQSQIEAFRTEPALMINLLRLTNSVGVGARTCITSVRQAITVLGRRQLQRWLQLLLFSRSSRVDLAHNPLLQLAALRGRFMELLVAKLLPGQRELSDPAFITGLMSVVPAALGMSMTDVLAQISVGNEVRLALTRREGPLGKLFALIERYDENDIAGTETLLAAYGPAGTLGLLGEILGETLAWVQQLGVDAG